MAEKIYGCGVVVLCAAILSLIVLMMVSLEFSFTARLLFKEPIAATGLAVPVDLVDPYLSEPLRIVRQDPGGITVSLPPKGQELRVPSSLLAGLLLPEAKTATMTISR